MRPPAAPDAAVYAFLNAIQERRNASIAKNKAGARQASEQAARGADITKLLPPPGAPSMGNSFPSVNRHVDAARSTGGHGTSAASLFKLSGPEKRHTERAWLTDAERATLDQRERPAKEAERRVRATTKQIDAALKAAEVGDFKPLQTFLAGQGYNVRTDGVWGAETKRAYDDFVTKYEADVASATELARLATPQGVRAESNAVAERQAPRARNRAARAVDREIAELEKQLASLPKDDGGNIPKWAQEAYGNAAASLADVRGDLRTQLQSLRDLRTALQDPNRIDNATAVDIERQLADANAAVGYGASEVERLKGLGKARDPQEIAAVIDRLEEQFFADLEGNYGNEQAIARIEEEFDATVARLENEGAASEGRTGTSLLLGLLNYGPVKAALDRASATFAAAQIADTNNPLVGLQGFAHGLVGWVPGLGNVIAPEGSAWREAQEATNTYEERAALTEAGQLMSPGEYLVDELNIPELTLSIGDHDLNVVSGLLDFTIQTVSDPFLIGSVAAAPLRQVGTRVGQQALKQASKELVEEFGEGTVTYVARAAWLQTDSVGRGLSGSIDNLVSDITRVSDVGALQKAVPGLPDDVASKVVIARLTTEGGEAASQRAAAQVLKDAFAEGTWNPTLTLRDQAANRASRGLSGVGRRTLRPDDRSAWLRRVVNDGESHTATVSARSSRKFVDQALTSSSRAGKTTWRAAHADKVAPRVRGTSSLQRFWNTTGVVEAANDPVLARLFEDLFRPFFTNKRLLDTLPQNTYMTAVTEQQGFELVLRKAEVLVATYDGKLGAAARSRLLTDMRLGFTPKRRTGNLVATAAKGTGTPIPKTGVSTEATIKAGLVSLDDSLTEYFEKRLTDALALGGKRSKNAVDKIGDDLRATLGSRDLRDELARLVKQDAAIAGRELALPKRGLGRAAKQFAPRQVLDVIESAPPHTLKFTPTENEALNQAMRVDAIDRVAGMLRLPDSARQQLRMRAGQVTTEKEWLTLRDDAFRLYATKEGVDPDSYLQVLKAQGNLTSLTRGPLRLIDPTTGAEVSDLQALSQLVEEVVVPTANEVASALRTAILSGIADGSKDAGRTLAAQLRVFVSKESSIRIIGGGIDVTLKSVHAAHRLWKFLIVTNAGNAVIGAAGGFFGTDDSLSDRFKNAGLGFAFGALGGGRYVARVALIEEGLRKYLAEGATPSMFVPGLAKWRATRGGVDPFRRFFSDDAIRAGSYGSTHYANELMLTVDNEWGAIARKDARYLDTWGRVVNHQINPESDEVIAVILREKAGQLTKRQADDALGAFFKTPEGKLHLQRFKQGVGGTGNKNEIVSRTRRLVDTHLPTPELAELRVSGGLQGRPMKVPKSTLKEARKQGLAPALIHGQKSSRIPRGVGDVYRKWRDFYGGLVVSRPTTFLNRRPMANAVFLKEYDRLIREGVDPARAQRIADSFAVKRTNAVLFNLNDQSRFAAKVDLFLPFQQPREELLKVWPKLVFARPARAIVLAERAALAFNNGKDQGIFTKNDNGEWQLTIPGSARLGRLFGMPFELDFKFDATNMLFFNVSGFTGQRTEGVKGIFRLGVIPSFGGPFWSTASRKLYERFPEFFETEGGAVGLLKDVLFPYGPSGDLAGRSGARLWMAMTGEAPPWEVNNQGYWKEQIARAQVLVAQELIYKHRLGNPGDLDWVPSDAQVKDATKAYFKTWAVFNEIAPASPYAARPSRALFDIARDAWTMNGSVAFEGDVFNSFLDAFPEYLPFLVSTSRYVGPDEYAELYGFDPEGSEEFNLKRDRYYDSLDFSEWKEDFNLRHRTTTYYQGRSRILNNPNPIEREAALTSLNAKYPDVVTSQNARDLAEQEYALIVATVPKSQQEQALALWRSRHGLSVKEGNSIVKGYDGLAPFNPWEGARTGPEIAGDVARNGGTSRLNEKEYVSNNLSPAEQLKFVQHKQNTSGTTGNVEDAQAVMEDYRYYQTWEHDIRVTYPFLNRPVSIQVGPKDFDAVLAEANGDIYEETDRTYEYIGSLTDAMQEAAESKNWDLYYTLRPKRDTAYAYVEALRAYAWGEDPNFEDLWDDMDASFVLSMPDFDADFRAIQTFNGAAGVDPILSLEERSFQNMPAPVQDAYLTELVQSLDMPPGDIDYELREYYEDALGAPPKLFWSYLTPFQQSLLERALPQDAIQQYKSDDEYYLRGEGAALREAKRRGTGSGSSGSGGGGLRSSELELASSLFDQYNKRNGMAKPGAYAEYLDLPRNPAVRADFLRKHPDVAEYIRLGPLANMPPLYREIVVNTMIRYGKWEGEAKSIEEVTDIAFAQEQLRRWSRRPEGALAPETYFLWRDMPTGVEKAEYLRAHPEVQEWIRLGPMANMPDDYQAVVRDIMQRYGEWTEAQDGLGKTIAEFFKLPRDGKDKYLLEHPELEVYFSLSRDPAEQRMFDLSNTYFGLQDVGARRAFLMSHPDLQQHFVDARSKRYERFLNQVAQYMGSNPELFTEYLERQEDVLAELLRKYAEPMLISERTGIAAAAKQDRRERANG